MAPTRRTTRDRLLAAAHELFTRNGIEGTTLETIANEAGVHRATLHRIFPGGRNELVAEVVLHTGLDTVDATRAMVADAPTVMDGLVDLFTELVLVGRKDPVVRQAVVVISDDLARGDARLDPIIAEGTGPWWTEILTRAEREGIQWREVDPVWAITHVLRVLASLIREPGRIDSAADVRAYTFDFIVPCLIRNP